MGSQTDRIAGMCGDTKMNNFAIFVIAYCACAFAACMWALARSEKGN